MGLPIGYWGEAVRKTRVFKRFGIFLSVSFILTACSVGTESFNDSSGSSLDAGPLAADERHSDDDEGIPGYFKSFDDITVANSSTAPILDFSNNLLDSDASQYFVQLWLVDASELSSDGYLSSTAAVQASFVTSVPARVGAIGLPMQLAGRAVVFVLAPQPAAQELNFTAQLGAYAAAGVVSEAGATSSISQSNSTAASRASISLTTQAGYEITRLRGLR